jgi:uncharacterized protein with HEPN domain
MTAKDSTKSPQPSIGSSERTGRDRSEFENNEMLQVWVLHHLQIIGVAAGCLSEDLRKRHPDRVRANASGMRNTPGHHYFEIDA